MKDCKRICWCAEARVVARQAADQLLNSQMHPSVNSQQADSNTRWQPDNALLHCSLMLLPMLRTNLCRTTSLHKVTAWQCIMHCSPTVLPVLHSIWCVCIGTICKNPTLLIWHSKQLRLTHCTFMNHRSPKPSSWQSIELRPTCCILSHVIQESQALIVTLGRAQTLTAFSGMG